MAVPAASDSTSLTDAGRSAADAGSLILLRVYGTLVARGLSNEVSRTAILAAAAEVTRGVIDNMQPDTICELSKG